MGKLMKKRDQQKHKAELYDEVWQKARDLRYENVTMALADIVPLRAEINRYADMLDDTSKAYGFELARIEGERDQLQAELTALRNCGPDSVQVPAVELIAKALNDVQCFHDLGADLIAPTLHANLLELLAVDQVDGLVRNQHEARAELVALDGVTQALKLIVKYYPDPNTSHVDYRVRACRLAEQALAELSLVPAKAEPVVNLEVTTECRLCNGDRRIDVGKVCANWVECPNCKAEPVEQCAWPSGEFDNCRHLVLPGKKYCKHHQQWEGHGND